MFYKKPSSIFFILIITSVLLLPVASQAISFDYELMETIPGYAQAGSIAGFNGYVVAIYKFALWIVGIAALLMLSIGAYMYLTSAGNNSAMANAKGVITDALVGLGLAMVAWLLLYTINPSLVSPEGIPEKSGQSSMIHLESNQTNIAIKS